MKFFSIQTIYIYISERVLYTTSSAAQSATSFLYPQSSTIRTAPPNETRYQPQHYSLQEKGKGVNPLSWTYAFSYITDIDYPRNEISTPAATAEPITPEILLAIQYCKT